MLIILDDDTNCTRVLTTLVQSVMYMRYRRKSIPILAFHSVIELHNWVIKEGNDVIKSSNYNPIMIADVNTPEDIDPSLSKLRSTPFIAWLTERMKEGALVKMPIIAISGELTPETTSHTVAAGCEKLIGKPISSSLANEIISILVDGYTTPLRWEIEEDNKFVRPLLIQLMQQALRVWHSAKQRRNALVLTSTEILLILSGIYKYLYCRDDQKQARSELLILLGGEHNIRERIKNDIPRLEPAMQYIAKCIVHEQQVDLPRRKKESTIDAFCIRLAILWNEE